MKNSITSGKMIAAIAAIALSVMASPCCGQPAATASGDAGDKMYRLFGSANVYAVIGQNRETGDQTQADTGPAPGDTVKTNTLPATVGTGPAPGGTVTGATDKNTVKTNTLPATVNTGPAPGDTVKGTKDEKVIKTNSLPENRFDQIKSIDSTKYNIFGNLLKDDPEYTKRNPWWRPIGSILEAEIGIDLFNRYYSKADFARIGFRSWRRNIETGWEWDTDRFGMNFFAHPYSGALSIMAARANGYTFWEALPYAVGGSLLWEYFGETTLPSYNDVINTPISGAFFGEIMYRVGSNMLDDRKTGAERFFRELGAAVISPTRFMNRLFDGKLKRVTTKEVYQKEPMNVELAAGMRKLNDGNRFGTGKGNASLNIQLDYGYPFEKRSWKPYDYFKIRMDANFGVGRKILDNVTGYGVLFGKTIQSGKLEMLVGGFQHFNYFDNMTYELGAISIGGGLMSKYPVSQQTYIFTNFHLGIVPLAGNSTRLGPDTTQLRDYNYCGGFEAKLESGVNLGWSSFQFIGYEFMLRTYVGIPGTNYISIIRPRVTVKLVKNVHMGFEQLVYYTNRHTRDFGNFNSVRTEQKLYLMLNVGNLKL